jgi:hypothetical protein
MKVELDARGNGIFIPRKLLDELEIDEANILISAKRMLQEACEEYLSMPSYYKY